MTTFPTRAIGLVGGPLAALLAPLENAGRVVFGGTGTSRQDAEQINVAVEQGHQMVVLVADETTPGMTVWLAHMPKRALVGVVRTGAEPVLDIPHGVTELSLPATAADLLSDCGENTTTGLAHITVDHDGTVTVSDPPAAADTEDNAWPLPDEPSALPPQTEATPPASTQPPPAQPSPPQPWTAPRQSAASTPPPSPLPPAQSSGPVASGGAGEPPPYRHDYTPARHDTDNIWPDDYDSPNQHVDVFDATVAVNNQPAFTEGLDSFALAPVLVFMGGSGGVGKTSLSLMTAQQAGDPAHGDLKVLHVDMDRGQADVIDYLRLTRTNLPTAYDAAATSRPNPDKAIADKDRINAARSQVDRSMQPIHFSCVLGPPDAHGNQRDVPATTYQLIIAAARPHFDLIIVDTHPLKAADESGLIDGVAVPSIQNDGWALMVSRSARPSINNARSRLKELSNLNVDAARMMVAVNRVGHHNQPDPRKMREDFLHYAHYVGAVDDHDDIERYFNGGKIYTPADAHQVIDTVLYRVTGRDVFAPEQHRDPHSRTNGRSRNGKPEGLLARMFNR